MLAEDNTKIVVERPFGDEKPIHYIQASRVTTSSQKCCTTIANLVSAISRS